MNAQGFQSLLRTLGTALGSYLVGRAVIGHTIDQNMASLIIGALMAIASMVWGFFDKATSFEAWESLAKTAITSAGAFAVAWGIVSQQTLNTLLALIPVLAPAVLSWISRAKNKAISNGSAVVDSTKGTLQKGAPKVSIILLLIFGTMAAHAQSPFLPEPHPAPRVETGHRMGVVLAPAAAAVSTVQPDSIINAWRFGVNIAPVGFTLDGVYHAGAGTSFGYQHQSYNYSTQTLTVLWSANFVWIPLVTGQQITSIKSFAEIGATYGFYHNNIQLGPMWNPQGATFKQQFGFMAYATINLN